MDKYEKGQKGILVLRTGKIKDFVINKVNKTSLSIVVDSTVATIYPKNRGFTSRDLDNARYIFSQETYTSIMSGTKILGEFSLYLDSEITQEKQREFNNKRLEYSLQFNKEKNEKFVKLAEKCKLEVDELQKKLKEYESVVEITSARIDLLKGELNGSL